MNMATQQWKISNAQWFISEVWWFVHFITGEPRFGVHQYSRCENVANIFAQNYSYEANGSDAPKIEVSFHLLMFAYLGGC